MVAKKKVLRYAITYTNRFGSRVYSHRTFLSKRNAKKFMKKEKVNRERLGYYFQNPRLQKLTLSDYYKKVKEYQKRGYP